MSDNHYDIIIIGTGAGGSRRSLLLWRYPALNHAQNLNQCGGVWMDPECYDGEKQSKLHERFGG